MRVRRIRIRSISATTSPDDGAAAIGNRSEFAAPVRNPRRGARPRRRIPVTQLRGHGCDERSYSVFRFERCDADAPRSTVHISRN